MLKQTSTVAYIALATLLVVLYLGWKEYKKPTV
jgi:hypothetical protein